MKIKSLLLAFVLMFTITATTLNAAPLSKKAFEEKALTMTPEQKEARLIEMKQRVEQIRAMDRSKLSRSERKALREELKNMNKEAKANGSSGIYISLGALIIIVLLLLLLL